MNDITNSHPKTTDGALSEALTVAAGRHSNRGPAHQRDLLDHLNERLEDVLMAVLGEPKSRDGAEWRWGSNGSLSVNMSEKRGVCYSHEDKVGGDIIKLLAWKWAFDLDADWPKIEARATALLDELPEARGTYLNIEDHDQTKWSAIEVVTNYWEQGGELTDHHGKAYLQSRKIDPEKLSRSVVREAQHKSSKKPETNSYPALIFPLTDAKEYVVGIHAVRCPQGELLVNAAKISNGQLKGAAIKITGSSTEFY